MHTFLRFGLKTIVVVAAIAGGLLLAAWPWPAPEVDWRTPLAAALAENDCDRAGKILDAATDAGSLEAYEFAADREAFAPCYDRQSLLLPNDMIARNGESLRRARGESGPRGGLATGSWSDDLAALGFATRQYGLAIDFFCLQPYDTDLKTDYAALSAAVGDEAGWLSSLHRMRRTLCTALANDFAAALAARGELQAKRLARSIALWPPGRRSAGAAVVLAELVLAQDFIEDPATRNNPESLFATRLTAWRGLSDAANSGDAKAMGLMISLVSKGRFVEDGLYPPRTQAYFWILRSRRLGLPDLPLYGEIERALSDEDRTRIRREEETDWQSSKASPPRR